MSKDAGRIIYLHISPLQKVLIDRAADALGRNRSDFIVETVCQKATAVLLDKNFLLLDEQIYKRFRGALDKSSAENNSRLGQLLDSQVAWGTGSLKEISPPERLSAAHDIATFDCGVADLSEWVKKGDLALEETDRARTYVVCVGRRVVGYYALGNGAVAKGTATGNEWDNMPDPVPVVLLGRLAVDRSWQGRGIGRNLLRDVVLRTLQENKTGGFRAILVQARIERVKQFHERCGFRASLIEPMTLMLTVAEAMKGSSHERANIRR